MQRCVGCIPIDDLNKLQGGVTDDKGCMHVMCIVPVFGNLAAPRSGSCSTSMGTRAAGEHLYAPAEGVRRPPRPREEQHARHRLVCAAPQQRSRHRLSPGSRQGPSTRSTLQQEPPCEGRLCTTSAGAPHTPTGGGISACACMRVCSSAQRTALQNMRGERTQAVHGQQGCVKQVHPGGAQAAGVCEVSAHPGGARAAGGPGPGAPPEGSRALCSSCTAPTRAPAPSAACPPPPRPPTRPAPARPPHAPFND